MLPRKEQNGQIVFTVNDEEFDVCVTKGIERLVVLGWDEALINRKEMFVTSNAFLCDVVAPNLYEELCPKDTA